MNSDGARAYIKSLRNPAKAGYAYVYWNWLFRSIVERGFNETEPQPSNLSAMAAQAVRMRLREFTK